MLAYVKDIDRLATTAIQVKHFATHDLVWVKSSDLVQDILPWMIVNDFDVVPLQATSALSFVQRKRVSTLRSRDKISLAEECVKSEQLVKDSVSIKEALKVLQQRNWFFVTDDNGLINGIVTYSDLARPALSMYVFARIISIEHGLRRLLGTYSHKPIPDKPPKNKKPDDPSRLFDLIKKIQNEDELLRDLKYTSEEKFSEDANIIRLTRNHLAHGGSLLDMANNTREVIEHVSRIDEFSENVTSLLLDRNQVWQAFINTQIVQQDDERVWSGPDAITLPWPSPIHVINACNPFEEVLTDDKNQERNSALKEILNARNLKHKSVIGKSTKGPWEEICFAVHGLSREQACELASRFGQRAIFEIDNEALHVISAKDMVLQKTKKRIE